MKEKKTPSGEQGVQWGGYGTSATAIYFSEFTCNAVVFVVVIPVGVFQGGRRSCSHGI